MARKKQVSSETCNSVFARRLSEMMRERGVSQKGMADSITKDYEPIRRQTISNYMSGQSEPNTTVLAHIAEALEVSSDYLIGLSEVKSTDENIRSACDFLGISDVTAEVIKDYTSLYGDLFERIIKSHIWYEVLRDMQNLLKQEEAEGQRRGLLLKWNEAILYSDFVEIVRDVSNRNKRDFEREAFEKGRVIAGFDLQIKEEPDGEHKKD